MITPMKCVAVSTGAITFSLRPQTDGAFGWALATVNNATGEVNIQSDWGEWGYRWHVGANSLGTSRDGSATTLVEFIGARDAGHCDYLANKLARRDEKQVFDSYASVKHMRARLVEKRIEQVRAWLEYYREEDSEDVPADMLTHSPPKWAKTVEVSVGYRTEKWPLSKGTCRSIYDELGDLEGCDIADDFCRRFHEIEANEWVISDSPWEIMVWSPSGTYKQLEEAILPALVLACAEYAKANRPAPAPILDGAQA